MAARGWVRSTLAWVIRLSQALGLTAVLLAALVAGGVLHANTPAARRLTAALLTRELSSAFSGTITVGGVEHLSPYGVIATDLRVQDPNGATVLVLSDLKIKVDAIELADKYLFGESKVTLVVRHVRAERAEVFVIPDAKTGIPTIAAAFTPVPSAPTAPSTPPAVLTAYTRPTAAEASPESPWTARTAYGKAVPISAEGRSSANEHAPRHPRKVATGCCRPSNRSNAPTNT